MDSVLCAVGICKGRRHWECSQGRLCVEERLSHWVLKHKQEVADAKARGQSGGAPSSNVTYQPSPWLWWFVSAFPLEMTDSATQGSSCLSGAIPGPGTSTPCCRGCGALIKETAEARDPGQRGWENQRPQWGRDRESPERSRVPCGESQGEGQEQTLAGCASRACPCPLLPRETRSSVTPLIHQTFPDGFLQDSFLSFAHLTRLPVTTERVNSGIRNHSSSN